MLRERTKPARTTIALLVTLLGLPIGCAMPVESFPDGDEGVGEAAEAVVAENALVPNALVPNALVPNALVPNALVPNALTPSSLAASALAAIKDASTAGTLSRLFLKYAVGCAFSPSQSFSFSWTDSQNVAHQETYYGILGIAPGWISGPISKDPQELISACIAGRTNYYGTAVTISVRSLRDPLKTLVNSSELTAYPYIEGAFWGNLFVATPHLTACYTTANVAHSRAALRECATGHLDGAGGTVTCGMVTILGSCESRCKTLDSAGKFYPECTDPAYGSSKNVVTSALP